MAHEEKIYDWKQWNHGEVSFKINIYWVGSAQNYLILKKKPILINHNYYILIIVVNSFWFGLISEPKTKMKIFIFYCSLNVL